MNPYRHTPADRARQTRRDETEAFIRANVRGDTARPATGKRYKMLAHPILGRVCGPELWRKRYREWLKGNVVI